MVPCFMRYALFRSSGASGRACRTALRAATALPVKSSTESWSSLSWAALPPRSLKPSTGLTIPSCRLSCVSRLSAGFWVSISLAPVRRVEHLGQVQDAGVVSGAPQAPSEVHQAARVAGDQGVGPALLQGLYLLVAHRGGDGRHLYREGPAEPAAELLLGPAHEVQALHPLQQLARLAQQPELPPLVAARVEDGLTLMASAEIACAHAHHVHEKVRELADAA